MVLILTLGVSELNGVRSEEWEEVQWRVESEFYGEFEVSILFAFGGVLRRELRRMLQAC